MNEQPSNDFETIGTTESRGGFFRDIWGFLRQEKKWWLTPILILLLLFGLLVLASGTSVAPFIYTLF
jgi:hypothetical protein